jgi:hypothetical protein
MDENKNEMENKMDENKNGIKEELQKPMNELQNFMSFVIFHALDERPKGDINFMMDWYSSIMDSFHYFFLIASSKVEGSALTKLFMSST